MNAEEMRAANEALFALIEERGSVTAKEVVAEARSKENPMHPRFEWDDSVAGERWREEQARGWIRSLRVQVEVPESPPIKVRRFVAVPAAALGDEDSDDERYMDFAVANQDPACWESVLDDARVSARTFSRKLSALEAIKPGAVGTVIAVVDEWLEG